MLKSSVSPPRESSKEAIGLGSFTPNNNFSFTEFSISTCNLFVRFILLL